MHFKMLSAVCFNLDQSKILLSGDGLNFDESKNCQTYIMIVIPHVGEDSLQNPLDRHVIDVDPDSEKPLEQLNVAVVTDPFVDKL